MTEPDLTKFHNALAERRRKKELEAQALRAHHPSAYKLDSDVAEYQDLVPDADTAYERTEADVQLDAAVERIDILDAHRKWIGKAQDNPGNKRENIMIGCPFPGHADKVPSAAVNLDKQTFMCYRCEKGGDTYDIAAIGLGYDYDRYKKDGTFGKLKREMAEAFGYTYVRTVSGPEWVEPEPAPTPPPPSSVAPVASDPTPATEDDGLSAPMAEVVDLFTGERRASRTVGIEWREIVPENTFLRTYMEMVTQDDVPEEYHFWNGLVAISLALGRDVTLKEASPVYGNLFVCLLGDTGHGKSRSQGYLKKLLSQALPYDASDAYSKGAKIISAAASAEALIKAFRQPITDPGDPNTVLGYSPVRGYVDFNELSSLMGRANRDGNILKPQLIEMYDAGDMRTMSLKNGDMVAKDTYGCVITTSQPDALRGMLTQEDATSGFLNRWVFAFARHKEQVWINRFEADLTDSIAALKGIQGWAGFGKQLEWDDNAEHLADTHFRSVIQPAKQNNPILSRLDLLTKKLILLFAANAHHDSIKIADVEMAISMHRYLVDAFVSTEASVTASRMGDLEDKLLMTIRDMESHGASVTASTLSRRVKGYERSQVNTALETLIKMEFIKGFRVNEGQRGRPTYQYKTLEVTDA